AVLEVAADYQPAVESVRSDLVEAAKVTGSFRVRTAGAGAGSPAVPGEDQSASDASNGSEGASDATTKSEGAKSAEPAETGGDRVEAPVRVRSVELGEAPARPARS
uniref:hypothetical protein n=1 Tax=Actinomyces wuliandei TaxID=2057743 RepID=UPI0015D5769F